MIYTESSLAAVVTMSPRSSEMSLSFIVTCADYWWLVRKAMRLDAADVFVLYCMGGEL